MNKLIKTIVAGCALFPLVSSAAIYLDGKVVDSVTLKTQGNHVIINSKSGGNPTPTPEPEPTPTPTPEPTPDPTDCSSVTGNVVKTSDIIWTRSSGSNTRYDIPFGTTYSSKLVTTNNTAYIGQISITSVTGQAGLRREAWFSECPGGPELNQMPCRGYGNGVTLYWSQGKDTSWQCNLETNKTYYLNYKCMDRSCGMYRNFYTNKKP